MSHPLPPDNVAPATEISPRRKKSTIISRTTQSVSHHMLETPSSWSLRRARKNPSYGIPLAGKRIMITGSSSGIGEQAAYLFAELGARVLLVARRQEQLQEITQTIQKSGGSAAYFPCDLRDLESLDTLVHSVNDQFGGVDILINNAGHSIRRPTPDQLDRWHDVERTMQINYFSPMRLIRGFLPGMVERAHGHIMNVASWGVIHEVNPLFAPYVGAKSALAQVTRTLNIELRPQGIHGTTLYFPLVRTPMITPTEEFNHLPTLSAHEAAQWMVMAARLQPVRVVSRISRLIGLGNAASPQIMDFFLRRAAQVM